MRRFVLFACWMALSIRGIADPALPEPGQLRLYLGDLVRVTVQGEPDMTVERRIDGTGQIDVPLLGAVRISGLTTGEARDLITRRYVKDEIFIHPEVVFTVVEYAPKEAMILGQVGKPGKVTFAAEATTLSIVDAIASAGDLTRIAKGDAVRVTRHDADGKEQTFLVNVEKLIRGREEDEKPFLLEPGDIVFVPERVF
jgi:polysaccharide export outer membrane protein